MKYPINTEKYITTLKIELGVDPKRDRIYREAFIPLVNDYYNDGLFGEGGELINPETILADFAHSRGLDGFDSSSKEIFTTLIVWCNRAYSQGMQDAKRPARCTKGIVV